MDFDELQKNWQSQPVDIPEADTDMLNMLSQKWMKQQRGVRRGNVFTTIGFAAVIINFCWVYVSFHKGRTILFGGSLLLMTVLLLVYLCVLWKGASYSKENPELSSAKYIDRYIERLAWRRKTLTTYSWIYAGLLWLALMLYFIDVIAGSSLLYKILAVGATTLYIFAMQFFGKRKKRKQQLMLIDELTDELKKIKESLN